MSGMTPQQLMQHELQCRATIINDLQDEKERVMEMVNRANEACKRLRDEVVFVTAQTHGIVKSMMLLSEEHDIHIPGHMFKKARGYQLEKGEKLDTDDEGSLRFIVREHTEEEAERETQLRAKIDAATKRIQP